MLFAMSFDLAMTLIGQPATYWADPASANEGNPLVRFVMNQGIVLLLVGAALYAAVAIALVTVLPVRLGLPLLLTLTIWHYYGASAWLQHHFHISYGFLVYGAALSVVLVAFGLDARPTNPDKT